MIQVIQGNLGKVQKAKTKKTSWRKALDHLDRRAPAAFLALSLALDCGKVRHSLTGVEPRGLQPPCQGVPGRTDPLGTLRATRPRRRRHLRPQACAQSGQNWPKELMARLSDTQVPPFATWEGACQVIQVIQGILGIGGKPKTKGRSWPNTLDHLEPSLGLPTFRGFLGAFTHSRLRQCAPLRKCSASFWHTSRRRPLAALVSRAPNMRVTIIQWHSTGGRRLQQCETAAMCRS